MLVRDIWKHRWSLARSKQDSDDFYYDRLLFAESSVLSISDSVLFTPGGHLMRYRLQERLRVLVMFYKRHFETDRFPEFVNEDDDEEDEEDEEMPLSRHDLAIPPVGLH